MSKRKEPSKEEEKIIEYLSTDKPDEIEKVGSLPTFEDPPLPPPLPESKDTETDGGSIVS